MTGRGSPAAAGGAERANAALGRLRLELEGLQLLFPGLGAGLVRHHQPSEMPVITAMRPSTERPSAARFSVTTR
jgi:hypothetical protein